MKSLFPKYIHYTRYTVHNVLCVQFKRQEFERVGMTAGDWMT